MTFVPASGGVWGIHGDLKDSEDATRSIFEDMAPTTIGAAIGTVANPAAGMPTIPDHTLVMRYTSTSPIAWGYAGDANGWPFNPANTNEIFNCLRRWGLPALPSFTANSVMAVAWGMGSGLVGRRTIQPRTDGKFNLLDFSGSVLATSALTMPVWSITSVADNGSGKCRFTTSVAHVYPNGSRFLIAGFSGGNAGYNGEFAISAVSSTTFDTTATFVATGTGTAAAYCSLVLWVDTYWGGTDVRTRLYVSADDGATYTLYIDDISHTAGEVRSSVVQATALIGDASSADCGVFQYYTEVGCLLRQAVASGDFPRKWAIGKYGIVADGATVAWTPDTPATDVNYKQVQNETASVLSAISAALGAGVAAKETHNHGDNALTGWTVSDSGIANGLGTGNLILVTTSAPHGLLTNRWLDITGSAAYLNQAWQVTRTGATDGSSATFTLQGSSWTIYGGGASPGGTITTRAIPAGNTIIGVKHFVNLVTSANMPDPTNLKHVLTDGGTDYSYDGDDHALEVSSVHIALRPSTGLRWTPADIDALTNIGLNRINSESTITVTAVANDGSGNQRFTTSAAHGMSAGKSTVLSGLATAAYNGVRTISNVSDATHFDIARAYTVNDSGSARKAYRLNQQSRLMVYSIANPSMPPVGKSLQLRQGVNRAAVY